MDTESLDPSDWQELGKQAHRMLDDMLEYVQHIRERPVWQPIPEEVRGRFHAALPWAAADLAAVHEEFLRDVLPYAAGNVHPGFMGWVHGGGTVAGMLAEMLAAGLNANLAGRDHMPVEVERQIVRWMCELFEFPESATGLFVTGTSMANLLAVLIARDVELGFEARSEGVGADGARLRAYASTAVHGCVGKALDVAGLGSDALRRVAVDGRRRIDLTALRQAIDVDRQAGLRPFLIVGTAGTVETGAIDDLAALAELAHREGLWFHVDGACGALGVLAPEVAPRLAGMERADSLAFDFHKWGQVPYDAGFLLVRDGVLHRKAFAVTAAYLRREDRGLAAGGEWACDYGPDLSRGFRALKTWFTLKVYGLAALGGVIARTCELARYLAERVAERAELELLAPVELNIVCFRYRAAEADRVNARIVMELHESGVAAPSTTVIDAQLAIRAAIVNHRTGRAEIDALVEKTVELGRAMEASVGTSRDAERPSLRGSRAGALVELEARIAGDVEAVGPRFERACLLHELGRTLEARDAYLDVLGRDAAHAGALNNLGTLLHATGYATAARTAYAEAVARHPGDWMGHVNLANVLREKGEWAAARAHYEAALALDAGQLEAHQGLGAVLGELGDEEGAARHRRKGFGERPVMALPYRGEGRGVRVLQLVAAAGGNIPTRHMLDDRVFETYVVLPEYYDTGAALPPHDLVWNAIGDADLAAGALVAAQRVLALSKAPLINPPAAVLATGRADNARRLRGMPGVVTAKTATLPRALLEAPDAVATLGRHGFGFPLLLRTPGFHTGRHFVRVEGAEGLAAALGELPGRELNAMEYLDARGPDGKVRKYRVMTIGGRLYPLHAAISSHWKIHYFTAEMADHAEHRAEDAAFLENMAGVLGERAMEGLRRIQSTLGLDYAGIDFGLSAAGDVLVFEANATMVVNPPEAGERWEYRRAAVERIFEAVRGMLMERAGRCSRSAEVKC